MDIVSSGDRVQILCATRLEDGTFADTDKSRAAPYWIKAGQTLRLEMISQALIGMRIGERKTLTVTPAHGLGRRTLHHDFEIVAIKKSSVPVALIS